MKRSTDGSILILALWILFFLAALTVAAAGHVVAVLQAAERLQARAQARRQAGSAAAWAVAVIADQQAGHAAGTNHWDGVAADAWNRSQQAFALSPTLAHAGLAGRVSFVVPDAEDRWAGVLGEEGRLHLSFPNRFRLAALFDVLGVDPVQGAVVLAALAERGDMDDGLTAAQADGYDPFVSVEDLLLLDGVDLAFFASVSPHVTVYGAGDFVNVNSASYAVLVAFIRATEAGVASAAEAIAEQIVGVRRERGFTDKADFLARLSDLPEGQVQDMVGRGLDFSSTAFRGIASASDPQLAETGLEIEFVWDTIARRYVLWRER